MTRRTRNFAPIVACAIFIGHAGGAVAQSAQPAPQQTTATYEDWVVRCETRSAPQPLKTCEMVQFTKVQGQSGVLTQIAIGRPVKGKTIKLVIQVPIGVWLPSGVRMSSGSKDPGLPAPYKRCLPAACFADVDIRDDTIRKFRAAAEPGKLHFKDANQKDVALPVSFKGFSAAYDALSKE